MKNTRKYIGSLWMVLVLLVLAACGNGQQSAAPAGDRSALEKLAQAYRQVGESYPVQPQVMPPKGRKEFLNKVFKQAGYDYSATLLALVESGTDNTNQNQRDLVELLLIPGKGLQDSALDKLYTAEELVAVKQLREGFR
jgi:hypothetical protein